jgi:integrase
MWSDRLVGMSLTNRFGFEHTLKVVSTDLAIRNSRIAGGPELEDGIMPLTASGMRDVLLLSESDASDELHLMLQLGFGTGLRLGSIVDLKVATLEAAVIDPLIGWTRIAVGPDATPPVATKFGNSGLVPIPQFLLDRLKDYALSTRRLKRQALAAKEHRDLLFISRFGNPYGGEGSRAVNVEVMRLRKVARSKGIDVLRGFHFHRTRATFATMLMRTALVHLPVPDAVNLVREACLHRDESTTLKYVKFIESSKAISDAANSFTEAFMGYAKGASDA